METSTLLGLALVAVPISFNVLFGLLAKTFEYPDILRRPTSEILLRFTAGGSSLIITWWLFMLTAVAFVPMAVTIPSALGSDLQALNSFILASGIIAGLVQFLGLSRWVFLVPFLARESAKTDLNNSSTIDLIFQSANRFLGVAVGEHLGYLFTGLWSIGVGSLMLSLDNSQSALGVIGIIVGLLLALCSLEFVGKNEEDGWLIAALITPFVYILWSLWLIALGLWFLF